MKNFCILIFLAELLFSCSKKNDAEVFLRPFFENLKTSVEPELLNNLKTTSKDSIYIKLETIDVDIERLLYRDSLMKADLEKYFEKNNFYKNSAAQRQYLFFGFYLFLNEKTFTDDDIVKIAYDNFLKEEDVQVIPNICYPCNQINYDLDVYFKALESSIDSKTLAAFKNAPRDSCDYYANDFFINFSDSAYVKDIRKHMLKCQIDDNIVIPYLHVTFYSWLHNEIIVPEDILMKIKRRIIKGFRWDNPPVW